jgi:DNA-binding CsgD family transcriptional regulator
LRCPIIVGREREFTTGRHLIAEAAAGRSTVALLRGEAGIGKSRLAAALADTAARTGFAVLTGVCYEHDAELPFAPFLDALRQQLHGTGDTRANVTALLNAERATFARLLPELVSASPIALPPESEKRRLFEGFVALCARISASNPLLLVLEDLHWADETSLELLRLLPRRLGTARLLILATARSDEPDSPLERWLGDLERGHLLARLDLAPLSQVEVARMIDATTGTLVPPVVSAAIGARAEGNPFLIEEFLRDLTARVAETGRRAMIADTLDTSRIPASVAETVARRLATLDPDTRRVARYAAVAGRRFSFAFLRDLSALGEETLLDALRALIERQLIVETPVEGEAGFAFRHALTRDAVAAGLLSPERRRMHGVVARTLATPAPGRPPPPPGELAFHYHAAGEWSAALDWAIRAGGAARAVYANAEALAHYRRAQEAARHCDAVDTTTALALEHHCGTLLALLGEYEAAHEQLAGVVRRARTCGDHRAEGRALYELAGLHASDDYALALSYGEAALAAARAAGDARDEAIASNRLGNILVNQARFDDGVALHTAALAIFERLADPWGTADCHDGIAMAHYLAGDLVEARDHFRRAIALFEATGDRERLASCLTTRALYLAALDGPCPFDGTPDTCLAEAEEAVRLCRALGWRAGEVYALVAVACAHAGCGDGGAALRTAEEAHQLALRIDHQQWTIIARLSQAIIKAEHGDNAGAIGILEATRATAASMGATQWERRLTAWLAHCTLLQGRPQAAAALARPLLADGSRPRTLAERRALFTTATLEARGGRPAAALALIDRLDVVTPGLPHAPTITLLRAEILAALGQLAEADAALRDAHETAERHGPRGLRWRISAARARLARQRGQAWQSTAAQARGELQQLLERLGDSPLRQALEQLPEVEALLTAPERAAGEGLTRREREIATQVAAGKTNRQIAATLFIAQKTVEMHVGNCLGKLGFQSRAQLAAWAVGREPSLAPPSPDGA